MVDARERREGRAGAPDHGEERVALVLSGGGSKGAFSVGVVAELYKRYRGTGWFSIVGGASTGAIIAPFAALLGAEPEMADEVLSDLIDAYTSLRTSDILSRRGWIEFVRKPQAFNASDPLRRLLRQRFRTEWFDWLNRPEAPECYVLYTNFRTGRKVAASPRDMDLEAFIEAIVASASVPGLMDATYINGDACFDGCLRDLVPLDHAIELGATTLVPVVLEPEEFGEQTDGTRRFDRILTRAFSILVDEVGRSDLEIARDISRASRVRERLEEIDRTLGASIQTRRIRRVRREIAEIVSGEDLSGPNRVHRVVEGLRPRYRLTHDWLSFDPEAMKSWLDHGRSVAGDVIDSTPFL